MEMVKDAGKVDTLVMTGGDLSYIDEDLLYQTVRDLRQVSLIDTRLTTEQLLNILQAVAVSSSMESLNLSSNNLSNVPSELIVAAARKLTSLSLENSSLSQEQCKKLVIEGKIHRL